MNRRTLLTGVMLLLLLTATHAQQLKWVVYDFDGLTTGQSDLPDGDYKTGDLSYRVAPNPFGKSDMLGDRVLQMELNWASGVGEFGKSTSRYIELDPNADFFNFYFYNPPANGQSVTFSVVIYDDDDNSDSYQDNTDDRWVKTVTANAAGGWELFSIPLNSFTDGNAGGNGAFDLGYTGLGGMLLKVVFRFTRNTSSTFEQYYADMLTFSEGALPHGATIFDLPAGSPGDYCLLGAFTKKSETDPSLVPADIEPLFPADNRLHYVNWFLAFSENGTTVPNKLPGNSVKALLDSGYTPIITWEPLYNHLARLDPAQPRLNDLISGAFDTYYDAFGDKLASYNDTVIVRFMHEFEGNWYPWSLTENFKDPTLYVKVFRYVVDKVRARGATKVKWMWCLNAEPAPFRRYNWVKDCYPGDSYVDIVATDIYNHPNLGVPDWKSFRYTGIESYYYLTKYFPHKPLYICEIASRERYGSEDPSSQTKAEWLEQTDKDMRSFFSRARAMVFFSAVKEHDWRVNSSAPVMDVLTQKVWQSAYYKAGSRPVHAGSADFRLYQVYPNPFSDYVNIQSDSNGRFEKISVYDVMGRKVYEGTKTAEVDRLTLSDLMPGIYIVEIRLPHATHTYKLVKRG
jgi:hypothetical protein